MERPLVVEKGSKKFELVAMSNGKSYMSRRKSGEGWIAGVPERHDPVDYSDMPPMRHSRVTRRGCKLLIAEHWPSFKRLVVTKKSSYIGKSNVIR